MDAAVPRWEATITSRGPPRSVASTKLRMGNAAWPGPPARYTIGSGALVAAWLRTTATGSCTWARCGRSRFSGTVSTPHSALGSLGMPASHGPGSNLGVYLGAGGVVATRLAEAGTIAKTPVDRASVAAAMTANVVDVTLTRARLAKGSVDICLQPPGSE